MAQRVHTTLTPSTVSSAVLTPSSGSRLQRIEVAVLAAAAEASVRAYERLLPAVAAGSDVDTPIFVAPFDCTVQGVTYIPDTAITGADTDSRSINVVNKGLDGNGTDEIASIDFTNTIDAADFDEKALTLNGTPANLALAEGEVVAAASVHVGSTGLADPGGLLVVTVANEAGALAPVYFQLGDGTGAASTNPSDPTVAADDTYVVAGEAGASRTVDVPNDWSASVRVKAISAAAVKIARIGLTPEEIHTGG